MGNIINKKKKSKLSDELIILKNRLDIIDKNHNSIISKEEFQTWADNIKIQYNNEIEEIKNKYINEITDNKLQLHNANQTILELNKQLDYLKNLKPCNNNFNVGETNINEISEQKINEIVEEFLSDDKINITLLPDIVEKQIYRNVISLALELLRKTLETAKIEFMGHNITFNVHPSPLPC